MRSYFTLGLISLVGAAAVFACGDDDGDGGGTAGTGGTAGAGGGAGTGGGAGNAGTGGSAGTAGTAGTGGGGNLTPPAANCTQCVQVTVPLPTTPLDTTNARSQAQANFVAAATAVPFDLRGVTSITWRVQALTTGANFYVAPFLQNSPPESDGTYPGSFSANTALTATAFPPGQWTNVTINIPGGAGTADAGADAGDAGPVVVADAGDAGTPPLLTAYDPTYTRIIGLAVGGTAAAAGELVSIEIDSVTVTGTSNFTTKTFDTSVDGLALNTGYQFPTGSTVTFH